MVVVNDGTAERLAREQAPAPPPEPVAEPSRYTDEERRVRALEKKKRALDALRARAKRGEELDEQQRVRLRSRAGVIKDLAAARAALQAAEGGESEGVESDGEPEPEPEPEPAARPKQARGAARPDGGAADTSAKPGVKRTLAERRELKRQKREERARSKREREEKRHAKLLDRRSKGVRASY